LDPEVLESLRRAGRIASTVRRHGAERIVAGARLVDVCEEVEEETRRLGGSPAFPAQTSVNHLAAHYCPPPGDGRIYAKGDLAKLDVGVHVDGFVVDTAVTVNVGDREENRHFVKAASEALEAAIRTIRPGVPIREVSAVISKTVGDYGLRPMKNLCGHGVGQWRVHCPPPIPNAPENSDGYLPEDSVLAIEPFATDGEGTVKEEGEAEVFRLPPGVLPPSFAHPEILGRIQSFRGLPFARRQLKEWSSEEVNDALFALLRLRCLQAYPPLAEKSGRKVSQAEHTVWVSRDGVEVLTR
jgi:methionyl aminopeptidase